MWDYGRLAWIAPITILFSCGGCTSRDLVLKKQAELEARLEQVVQAQAVTNIRVSELTTSIADIQAQLKVQALEVEQLKPGYRELKTSLETTSQRLEKLAIEAAVKPQKAEPSLPLSDAVSLLPKTEPQPESPAQVLSPPPETYKPLSGQPVSVKLDPQAAYQKAIRLYMNDKYADALASFEAFITTYPTHEYAANAQYWAGESLYSLKRFESSLAAFNKVISGYAKSSKVPDAMLKGAFALFAMEQRDKGLEMLSRLVEAYPRSAAAVKAKERLNKERHK